MSLLRAECVRACVRARQALPSRLPRGCSRCAARKSSPKTLAIDFLKYAEVVASIGKKGKIEIIIQRGLRSCRLSGLLRFRLAKCEDCGCWGRSGEDHTLCMQKREKMIEGGKRKICLSGREKKSFKIARICVGFGAEKTQVERFDQNATFFFFKEPSALRQRNRNWLITIISAGYVITSIVINVSLMWVFSEGDLNNASFTKMTLNQQIPTKINKRSGFTTSFNPNLGRTNASLTL